MKLNDRGENRLELHEWYMLFIIATSLSGMPLLFFATLAVAMVHWFIWSMFNLGDE